ncbi:uncharacterized protein CPUR_06442 [Claviceps purpurea 20.1]|uniref:Reverse transcriptase Ty1/copia-type domain-containing protein n=1 Tax=Claviceps purpurea (strain 20.1) TaxID=1111077 RepID=M1VX85_CLAP2|nr:uncharacterized protein CPUR_06442 [Claviceps purpurea 20.1]
MVREIKWKDANTPYEKSRLVVQGHNDDGKWDILTQSPTVQRASIRLLLALAPALMGNMKKAMIWVRDVTQAYVQSQTKLNRIVLARIPKHIAHRYPPGSVMLIVSPLYGVAESGTHWWATYSTHHLEKLLMKTSTYDPCLLIASDRTNCFGMVAMQTDDTLGLSDQAFSDLEDKELTNAGFLAKPKQTLSPQSPVTFNGCVITQNVDGTIDVSQKGQSKKLALIVPQTDTTKQQYVEQRARGAYVATVCQPEACFDLSVAAQTQDPEPEDISRLNKRLQWQIDHQARGLRYIRLDLDKLALYVFVDGSFANNRDLSSQIGYVIILGTEDRETSNSFTLSGNIVAYSSTKSKRVTRSALASELYAMVQGADTAYAMATTLEMITERLGSPAIPTVICTDSFSLYECLVKLGTTKEKRLMIDIMALRQSYERRELAEIRWINGEDNIADAMTKTNPNKALEAFINRNKATIRVEGSVARPKSARSGEGV